MDTERPLWQTAGILLLAVIIVIWGSYTYYYKGKIKKISELKTALETTEKEIELIRPADILQKGKLPIHELIEKQLEEISKKIPNELEIPYLLQGFIVNSARGLNINYDLITPLNPVQEQRYKRVPIKVSFSCNFESLNSYIMNLENLPITIRIDTLDVSKAAVPPLLNIKMDLSAFVSPGGSAKDSSDKFSEFKIPLTDPFFSGGIRSKPVQIKKSRARSKSPAKKSSGLPVFSGVFEGAVPKAFIGGGIAGVGESVNGYQVLEITAKKVIVKKSGKIYTLTLGR